MPAHSTIRSSLRRPLFALALGIATTILSAWILALATTIPMYPRETTSAAVVNGRPWNIVGVHRSGVDDYWWLDLHAGGSPGASATPADELITQTLAQARARTDENRQRVVDDPPRWGILNPRNQPPESTVIGSDTAFGWPMRCAWYRVTGILSRNTVASEELLHGFLVHGDVSVHGRSFRALPLRPIWLGLSVNSALYSLTWWVLLAGLAATRRLVRRRRGLCPHCAYDLRATPAATPCPECGHARDRERQATREPQASK